MARIIPEEVLVGLIEYLSTRPYREVFQAIPVLQGLAQAQIQEPPQGPRDGQDE